MLLTQVLVPLWTILKRNAKRQAYRSLFKAQEWQCSCLPTPGFDTSKNPLHVSACSKCGSRRLGINMQPLFAERRGSK